MDDGKRRKAEKMDEAKTKKKKEILQDYFKD
jgi:hypothetical protein